MGTWGVGMRENDTAADAVDTYGVRLDDIGHAELGRLLRTAKRRFGVEGALGLAEEALERSCDFAPSWRRVHCSIRNFKAFIPFLKGTREGLNWKK